MKAAAIALLAGLAIGASVNGYRWDAKFTALQRDHAVQESERKDRNLTAILEGQEGVLDAIQNAQYTAAKNEAAYAELTQNVISLRSTISGLRIDTKRFTTEATQDQLRAYATACTAVFHTMAAEIGSLGEEGARIARAADQHAADAKLIMQSK